jgi:hypothetical protein
MSIVSLLKLMSFARLIAAVVVAITFAALELGRNTIGATAEIAAFNAVPSFTVTLPENVRTPDIPPGAVETFDTSAAAPVSEYTFALTTTFTGNETDTGTT